MSSAQQIPLLSVAPPPAAAWGPLDPRSEDLLDGFRARRLAEGAHPRSIAREVSQLRGVAREAGAPVIAFAPGAGWALEEIAEATGADVIGVDWQTDAAEARRRLSVHPVALQGNLDPCWLYARPEEICERTRQMLAAFGPTGHIANLGHGILPDVPVEHARAFVRAVQEWRP